MCVGVFVGECYLKSLMFLTSFCKAFQSGHADHMTVVNGIIIKGKSRSAPGYWEDIVENRHTGVGPTNPILKKVILFLFFFLFNNSV